MCEIQFNPKDVLIERQVYGVTQEKCPNYIFFKVPEEMGAYYALCLQDNIWNNLKICKFSFQMNTVLEKYENIGKLTDFLMFAKFLYEDVSDEWPVCELSERDFEKAMSIIENAE